MQRANLCTSEIICIFLLGVMSYCSSHKDSFLPAQRMSLSGRWKAVSAFWDRSAVSKPWAVVSREASHLASTQKMCS
jgi:hypothetical protein